MINMVTALVETQNSKLVLHCDTLLVGRAQELSTALLMGRDEKLSTPKHSIVTG